jgi:glutathione reductase (NADPH)
MRIGELTHRKRDSSAERPMSQTMAEKDTESVDLVVIGTGAAGTAAATRCRKEGWRVAIVDDEPFGGTCALRGCDPKKVLVGEADLLDAYRRMRGFGLHGDDSRIDWPALMGFKRTFTEPVPEKRAAAFREAGIHAYHGPARFADENTLLVGTERIDARHFLVASGAEPRPLGIPGEEHVKTSTDFLELDVLPKRLVLIGAGYIAFEFAHIARRAGVDVVMFGRGRALTQFDEDLVDRLVDHTTAIGVDVRLNAPVTSVVPKGGELRVHFQRGIGHDDSVSANLVIHAAGRVPKTRHLALDRASVKTDNRGAVDVNEYLQSVSNPRVYAAGDAALPNGSVPLTPVAAHEGLIVASNLLHGNTNKSNYRGVPSVVFTVPPLARVGMSESDARAQGLAVRVKSDNTGEWLSNRRTRQTAAMFKTIVEEDTDRVLGAHLLGPGAEEVINLFALAIRHEIKARDLAHMLYAYPTSTSDIAYML